MDETCVLVDVRVLRETIEVLKDMQYSRQMGCPLCLVSYPEEHKPHCKLGKVIKTLEQALGETE